MRKNVLANTRIREYAKDMGVKLWEVAYRYGITDSSFSRKLRQELPQEEQEKILAIIDQLNREKQGVI